MGRQWKFLAGIALFFAALIPFAGSKPAFAQTQAYDESLYRGLHWRLIGPFRGGRVEAVTGLPHNDLVYYMGSVDGGVWETTDAGQVWEPIFEHGGVGSIGAVAVAPSDPNVIYVGTGEYCPRGDATYGDGVYKSTDGGKTWRHIGLTDTRHIARILIDPQDPNRVFVAALGHVYGPNEDRGVFRTTDGGQSWQKVLYKDDTTGAVDLLFDPASTQTLYAAMWTVQRKPWSLSSGGPSDGLYKSTDGGNTWQLMGGSGWPEGLLGRIGIAISNAAPNRIYALVEAEGDKRGLYRSDDGGESWRLINGRHYLIQRPWYFTHVFADPGNADTVYILDLGMWRSTDGGETFSAMREPHGDNHILWIDPNNSARMILGNDGGASVSNDSGQTWSSILNQPTAQFYHVAADTRFDYRIYGAQQDNSTVGIPTRTRHGTITAADFYDVGGGESGFDVPSPADPDIIFSGNKEMMTIARFNRRIEQDQDVSEWPISTYGWPAGPLKYRFQWTEPIFVSPFDPHTIYHAANVLFESTDDGVSWKAISPDLTRNDKSKQGVSGGPITKDNATIEYYDVIFAAAESPLERGLIWVGTDDGLVWLTRDDGAHWEKVTPKDMPEWSRVSMLDPSPHAPGAAYLAVNRYKNDDLKPYAWKTTDYGKTWTPITNGIPTGAFLRVVREDPGRRGLLFAGTETGAYVSFNDGEQWQSLQLNLPTVSVRDMLIHGDDLVIATHGRAFWSLDDITPLRQINRQIADSDVYLYKPAVAYRVRRGGGLSLPGGPPAAANPPNGAVIDYYLKSGGQDVTLDILNNQGKVIQHFTTQATAAPAAGGFRRIAQAPLTGKAGLNRFVWNLRYPAPPALASHPGPWQGGDARGPLALPGTYTIRLTASGKALTQPLILKMDPEVKTTEADLAKQFYLMNDINDRINNLRIVADQLHALRGRLAALRQHSQGQLLEQINSLDQKADAIEGELYQRYLQAGAPEDDLASPTLIRERLIGLEDTVDSADTPPTPQSYEVYRYLTRQLNEQIAKWNQLKTTEVPALEKAVAAAGLGHILEHGSSSSATNADGTGR